MNWTIRSLGPKDAGVLGRVAPGVFDDPVLREVTAAFLQDPRHHILVALDEGVVVGSVTAVHYLHPDKNAPELWINEVAVADSYRGQGIAKRLLAALLEKARELGCSEAWVLTDRSNAPALNLYKGAGGIPSDQVLFQFQLDRIHTV